MIVARPSGADAFERLEPAEVDRARDLGRVPSSCCDLDVTRGRRALDRRRAQRRAEAARLEQRRVDPLRELRRLVERLLDVARHLVEELPSPPAGSDVDEPIRELQVDRERDEVLLRRPSWKVALDPAAVGVGCEHEPLRDARSSSTSRRKRSTVLGQLLDVVSLNDDARGRSP